MSGLAARRFSRRHRHAALPLTALAVLQLLASTLMSGVAGCPRMMAFGLAWFSAGVLALMPYVLCCAVLKFGLPTAGHNQFRCVLLVIRPVAFYRICSVLLYGINCVIMAIEEIWV